MWLKIDFILRDIQVPDLVDSLSGLYAMLESRVSVFSKLCKLQGRLDLMLSQVMYNAWTWSRLCFT